MDFNFGIDIPTGATVVIGVIVVGYFILITAFGTYFSKFSKDINDFFFSGQRFAWWLAAVSMVATGIGSYSYLKYSEQGYLTGMSSTMTYMNDWFIVPFFMFGWLPILYFSRVRSIPEYFERRFNRPARYIAVVIILCYLFFYIGYNLFTIGVALEGMFGIPVSVSVPVVAVFLGAYVTFGGQTAVIFTDLFQGIMLYLAGAIAIISGLLVLGGLGDWWGWLPETHRLPFVHLTDDPKFNTSGLFWGEALAGSIAFSFMNQGFIMRYLAIKSVHDGRKAALFNIVVTLPLSAIIVGAVGWIAKALITKQTAAGGALEGMDPIHIQNTFHTFIVIVWETLYQNPYLFGFVVAALTAALMSTIDTYINACAAIGVYDIYKPLIKPEASDKHYLKAARVASVLATLIGLLMVVWFHEQLVGKGGNKVMYAGTEGQVVVQDLLPDTEYHVAVFKKVREAGETVYEEKPGLSAIFTTLPKPVAGEEALAPEVVSTGVGIAGLTSTNAALSWASSGRDMILLMKQKRQVSWRPTVGIENKANASFVKGRAQGGGSLMSLHYKGIMTIIPAIVTAIFLGAFWRRFTPMAACVSMSVGSILTLLTNIFPNWITPLSWFVGGPLNMKYIYMRSLYGMIVTAAIGVVVTFLSKPRKDEDIVGLTISTLEEAKAKYKGGKPNETVGKKAKFLKAVIDESIPFEQLSVSAEIMKRLKANEGDMIYVEDARWFLGGLRSLHTKAAPAHDDGDEVVRLSSKTFEEAFFIDGRPLSLEKIM